MSLGNILDIIILGYCSYNCLIGWRKGIVLLRYRTLYFISRLGITTIIYFFFSKFLLKHEVSSFFINLIKGFLIINAPVLDTIPSHMSVFSLWLFIYILVCIPTHFIFKRYKDISKAKPAKLSESILGFVYCLAESLIIVMLLVSILDSYSDALFPPEIKDSMSDSVLMLLFYSYNLFMNMFNFY